MTLKYFLYPIISKETLLNVQWDTGFFSIVYSYLKEVCNLVVDLITLQNYSEPSETDDGHLLHQVFVWYHDRKTNYDHREDISRNIKNFLKVSLKWKGLKDVQINPIVEENLIRIVDRSKTDRNLRIHILKQDKKASLKWNGDIVYEFSVREEDDYLSIEAKDDSTYMDRLETIFWLSFRKIMLLFIATLKIQLTKHNPHFDSLNKDENFKKALDNLVKELKVK